MIMESIMESTASKSTPNGKYGNPRSANLETDYNNKIVTPKSSRKRKLELASLLKIHKSMNCSKCSKVFDVETLSSNIKAECIGCLSKLRKEIGGYPLKMTDEQQLQKDFQCPICLLIIRDATELPCNHLMCKSCLIQNERYLTQSGQV